MKRTRKRFYFWVTLNATQNAPKCCYVVSINAAQTNETMDFLKKQLKADKIEPMDHAAMNPRKLYI